MKRIGSKEIMQIVHAYGRYTIDPNREFSRPRLMLLEKLRNAGLLRLHKARKDQWEYFKGETP